MTIACPACRTMLTHPAAPHRDLTGCPCPGLPEHPVCGYCGASVGLNHDNRAAFHPAAGQWQCTGSNRRVTTRELFAGRDGGHGYDDSEEAA